MSLLLKPAEGGSKAGSKALVPLIVNPERLIVDEMGSDMITLYVGPGEQPFSVHKNLICGTGKWFSAFLNELREAGQKIKLFAEDPAMFKLFVESLYTKTVPGVSQGADRLSQTLRLKNLCQLYAFTERYMLKSIVRNKVMDAIQDGFLIVKKFPESGLVNGVYRNTKPGSKLRSFILHGAVYGLRIGGYGDYDLDLLSTTLRGCAEMMGDFLSVVQTLEIPERDPRIRDCGGDVQCVECAGFPGRMAGMVGTWPCTFHIHGNQGNLEGEVESADSDNGCYLWSAVPL